MTSNQTRNVIKAAAGLPVHAARRVVTKLAELADQDEASGESAICDALAADMQPLGKALWKAYQAEDMPAMQAALGKISRKLPDFMTGGKLADAMGEEFAKALADGLTDKTLS